MFDTISMRGRDLATGFWRCEKGAVTIDFVMVFFPVMIFVLTVCELIIAFHFLSAAQKSAQLAARLAASRAPVHTEVWERNKVVVGQRAGYPCYQETNDTCQDPGLVWTCDGGSSFSNGGASFDPDCDSDRFFEIVTELRRLYPSVEADKISISYIYRRLGVAEGPFVPEVRVDIARRQSPVRYMSPIGFLEYAGLFQLRPATASVLGEDMRS